MSDNPFKQVYDALWVILDDSTALDALVADKNRIKLTKGSSDKNTNPEKGRLTAADMPELKIVPVGGAQWLRKDSSSTFIQKRFAILIRTGEEQYDDLSDVEWAVVRALSIWRTRLEALTWNSKAFVRGCQLLEAKNAVSERDQEKGWNCIWHGSVEMYFMTSDLDPS